MENLVLASFKDEDQAYQVLTKMKSNFVTDDYTILQAAIIQRVNRQVLYKDGFDSESILSNDWLKTGMIGALIGILAGPLGALLGGGLGSYIGERTTFSRIKEHETMLEHSVLTLSHDHLLLAILVQEDDEQALDHFLLSYDSEVYILRKDIELVEAELIRAKELKKEIEDEIAQKLKEDHKHKVNVWTDSIKMKFKNLTRKNN